MRCVVSGSFLLLGPGEYHQYILGGDALCVSQSGMYMLPEGRLPRNSLDVLRPLLRHCAAARMQAEKADIVVDLAVELDSVMTRNLAEGRMPGAVVVVWHAGQVLHQQAYGNRAYWQTFDTRMPAPEPATVDTIYDCASLTKLFTTTLVMQLVEVHQVALDEPVCRYVPEFAGGSKSAITVRQLLAHVGGLLPGISLWKVDGSPAERLRRALVEPPENPPATVMRYSDLGAIALGVLVERVTGEGLDALVKARLCDPLGLHETGFLPPASIVGRIAPTEFQPEETGRGMVRGTVHDENAWSLGGVAGHAGLFSTAGDLLRFARCHLNDGSLDGAHILSPDTARLMHTLQTGYLAVGATRALGWEVNQAYYMGRLRSLETYGHTGFTGMSMVIHPASQTIVLVLSNRVHPTRSGPPFNPVREDVANVVADVLAIAPDSE